jgi:diguanylate cyclase (GGDEF)-like protein/PAS domain S-box-containing protein
MDTRRTHVPGRNGTAHAGAGEAGYRLAFDRNPQPMWVYDAETLGFLAVNDAAVASYGYERERFLAMTVLDVHLDGERDAAERWLRDPAPSTSGEWRHVLAEGETIDVEISSDDLPFNGRHAKLVVAVDVTDGRRARADAEQRAAQQSAVAALGRSALDGMSAGELGDEAVKLVAETLHVELCELLERSPERDSLVVRSGVGWEPGLVRRTHVPFGSEFHAGYTWSSLGHVVVDDFAAERRFRPTPLLAQHDAVSGMAVIVGRRGQPYAILGAHTTLHRRFQTGELDFLKAVANVLAGALERESTEEKIRHQALHDSLTGLPNRMLLLERLAHWGDRARRSGEMAAIVYIDLDNFKLINDGLGHDCGDEVLRAVAERLDAAVRPSDTVARVGGDEFVVLCEDVASEPAAVEIVERLSEQFQDPFCLDGHHRHLSASIGIALADGPVEAKALLRDADAAMYRSKERGGGRFELFDQAMRERSQHWLRIERDLRRAIENGELHNLYQPIVSAGADVVGFEALVRWEHPTRGTVGPDEFIPVAEQTGLIVPIGLGVLRAACREALGWSATGPDGRPLHVSVNLSPRQVAHPDIVRDVHEVLESTGLEPERLKLEITETVLIEDSETALETLQDLKALGVGLFLDDFGTGYSSLAYVRRFPLDVLKIDRSFVDGLGRDAEDSAIVSAVISMGRALGVEVVAEGVETRSQADQLHELGCNLEQGYLYAPPLAPEAASDLLRNRS